MSSAVRTIGGCRIVCECGSGAYGRVFLAENALGQRVAIKLFFRADGQEKNLESLRRYIALQDSNSPNLLRIFHFGYEDGQLFYVMEAADDAGEDGTYVADSLALRLKRQGRLSTEESIAICQSLVNAISVLQDAKLVHRDIKPDNVLFVNGVPKLSDPDLLCNFSMTMSLAGTMGFIPPEAYNSPLKNSPTADIYALGKLLYVCATGLPPEAFPALPKGAGKEMLQRICRPTLRLCNSNPSRRCQSCEEASEILTNALKPQKGFGAFLLRCRVSVGYRLAVIGVVLLALFAFVGMAFGVQHLHRIHQMEHQQLVQRHGELEAALPALALSLDDEELQCLRIVLKCGNSSRSIKESIDGGEKYLRLLANIKMPELFEYQELTLDSIRGNGKCHGYLASPLARLSLDETERRDYADRLAIMTKKLYPTNGPTAGSNFKGDTSPVFKFDFVPPGAYISADGQRREIGYPLWIMPSPVNNDQYQYYNKEGILRNGDATTKATRVCWAAVIDFCKKVNDSFAVMYTLPPGYGVRPILESEYDYAVSTDWRGQKALTEEDYEYMLIDDEKAVGGCRPGKRNNTLNDCRKRGHFMVEQQMDPNICFRAVIAPICDDFYNKLYINELELGMTRKNGRVYFGGTVCYTTADWGQWLSIADSFGAHLVEPSSVEELVSIRRTLGIPESFPAFVGIEGVEGVWRYHSTGLPVEWPGLPPKTLAFDRTVSLVGGKLREFGIKSRMPGVVIEWPDDESFAKCGQLWRGGKASIVRQRFVEDGRLFCLVDAPLPIYVANSVCRRAGGRLAVLSDASLRQKVFSHIKGCRKVVALGGRQKLDGWQWDDGTPLGIDLPKHKRTASITSRFLLGICFADDSLVGCDSSEQLLVEFTDSQ